ncbi:MAG: N-acetylglucosamine-6-phosphate deacetylase [Chloroflexota bacterium]
MSNFLYIRPRAIVREGRTIEGEIVLVEGDRIVAVGPDAEIEKPEGCKEIIADDMLLVPGFIDLQINGGFGSDFTAAPDSVWEVAAQLPRYGVTAFLPTIITSPAETMEAAREVMQIGPPADFRGAIPLGLHLEGPFLSPEKRGAHNPAYLRLPTPEAVAGWSPETGVLLVTLAPELPGALATIGALVERGVVVSAGHSMATADEAEAGFAGGISYGTHLFNAMPPLDHRAPGLAGALLASNDVTVGLIADGIHLHPDVVALSWKAKGAARFSLVTDAMAALGMPPGQYRLGDWDVTVDGAAARLPDGRLAGSLLSLDQAVLNLVGFTGCEPAEALLTVTAVPAALLGIEEQRGHIAPGLQADLVLLTPELEVVTTIVGGQIVYSAPG